MSKSSDQEAPSGRAQAIRDRLEKLGASATFAYLSIALIQLRVVWNMWEYRDLTAGDTASYFAGVNQFLGGDGLEPLFSPAYVAYWAFLHTFIDNIYSVTILHRLLIVFALTLLVLAVLRAFLPAGIAWALAVWWAILPTNYDNLYEVHLFAAIPVLVAVLLARKLSGRRMHVTVFSLLVFDAFFVRNEVAVAAAIWGLVWLGWEIREKRSGKPIPWRRVAAGVAIPVAIFGGLYVVCVETWFQADDYEHASELKHTLNVCQIYAYGYEQRHDDYRGEPFTQCQPLMQRKFGAPLPTMTEAIKAHPSAMAEHFLWNVRLLPYGVEDMLFHHISSDMNHSPDYVPVNTGSRASAVGLVAVFLLVVAGGILLWRDRRTWWREWIAERAWAWVALLSLIPTFALVIITQRPRPSYLFVMSVLILILIGTSVQVIGSRWKGASRLYSALPLAAVALLALLPSHYNKDYVTITTGRPLKASVERLEPFKSQFQNADIQMLSPNAFNVCLYLASREGCTGREMFTLPTDAPIQRYLQQKGINFIYADEEWLANSLIGPQLAALPGHGWKQLAPADDSHPTWLLLRRGQ